MDRLKEVIKDKYLDNTNEITKSPNNKNVDILNTVITYEECTTSHEIMKSKIRKRFET
mgnify:FL=1